MSAARQKFTLTDDDKTITIDLLTPHRVARVSMVYPTAKSFTITVDHKPVGNSNNIRLIGDTQTAATFIWTPDNLWVRKDGELLFTNTQADAADITIDYVKDEEV